MSPAACVAANASRSPIKGTTPAAISVWATSKGINSGSEATIAKGAPVVDFTFSAASVAQVQSDGSVVG
eukprot:CAMPEP_0184434784 /NCGR_PEP_ID=MMETSP0738-20130409/459483_1 /TAXON_ID=385413 /ORGANISM="Thalassiosira miniscula, Strain CCMP1093" /LENGTH=68 /DNA_ID=CAMNT_0026800945 /DNA_START=44 /DNA_END=250 /DNA_ORIENTATION=+